MSRQIQDRWRVTKLMTCFLSPTLSNLFHASNQLQWQVKTTTVTWLKSLDVFFPAFLKLRKCDGCVITCEKLKMCKTIHKHELQSDVRFLGCHMCICCLRCSLALNVPKWTSSYITQKCQAVYCLPLWCLSVPGLWHHSGVCHLYVIVSPPSLPAC